MGYQDRHERDSLRGTGKAADALYEEIQQSMDSGSKREAIGGLRMLLAVYPDYALAHNDLGVLYYNEGEKEKALLHYEQAARLEPENVTFQKNLADFYCVEAGDLEEALKIYLKVLKGNPTDVETLVTIGDVCVSLGKSEDARVFYNRVLELEPWNMDAQGKLDSIERGETSDVGGQTTEDRGRWSGIGSQTTEDRYRGMEPDGESPEMIYERVQELVNEGRQAEAIQKLENLVERYPDYGPGHNDLGVLYYKNGEKEKALRHYEQAARLEPENATFQKNLADFFCIEMGELEEGLKIYLKVLEANPTDMETLLILGDICVSLGKKEDARVFYGRVLELEPWNMNAGEKLDALSSDNLIG
jgi:tetratricopeptide (TPR) repeat protein